MKFLANFLKQLGVDKAVMKSDGEHSIVALKDAAAKAATIEAIPEESPSDEWHGGECHPGDQEAHQSAEICPRRGHRERA